MDGSAQATSDYAPVNSVLVFPAGSTEGDIQCINVTILHDEIVEGTENLSVKVSPVGESSLIVIDPARSEATLSIADDEMVDFRIIVPSNVSEDSGSVMICIEQMNNQLSEDVYMEIKTMQIGSTATDVSDYDPLVTTLTFAAGSTGPNTLCDNIRIVDDGLVEGDEVIAIIAAIKNSVHGTGLLSDHASLTISDNDYVLYKWENPEYSAVEDSESLVIQLCLAAESGALTSQGWVAVTSVPISATENVDFTKVNGTLLFESSHEAGVCLPVAVTVIKDDLMENDEMFQLSASVGASWALFTPGGDITTIIIQDDDGCERARVSNDCTEATGTTQMGGGVLGGVVVVVVVIIVPAVIIIVIVAVRRKRRSKKRSEEVIVTVIEQEQHGMGGMESGGTDFEMSCRSLPEKDGSSQ